jgi:hypothetical protein
MSATSLNEFREMINDINDEHLLEVAEGLLKDIITIENMKERIEMLEDGLHKGDRAAFWFFAMGLDREEVDVATNTVIGRRRFLKDKEDRENIQKEIDKEADAEEE